MTELLRDGVYVRYWLAVVISFLGDGIARVTVIVVAAHLTASPALFIAVVVVAQLLPCGVLGAFVGPLVDRFPPRMLLVGSDLFRVAVVLLMITATHSAVLLVLLILVEGTGKAVFETARMAAIPRVVGRHSIPAAVALFQSTVQVLNLAGPLLGGLLIGLADVSVVFMLDAGTFVVSAVLLGGLAVLRDVAVVPAGAGAYLTALRSGVREVLAIPSLRLLAWTMVPVMLAIGLFTTNVNAQLLSVFDLSAAEYGVGQAMIGGGAIVGALVGPRLMRRWPLTGILSAAVLLLAASLVVLQPIQAAWPSGGVAVVSLWCALTGLAISLVQVPVANLLLRDLPEGLRGRGVALLNAVMVNFTVLGVVLGGVLGSWIGVTSSIVITGWLLAIPAFTSAVRLRRRSGIATHAEAAS